LELIPYIAENFNENIIDAVARLAQNAKEDNAYLREQAGIAYQSLKRDPDCLNLCINAEKMTILDRTGLRKLGTTIRRRVVLTAFQEIGLMRDISASHLNMIDRILFSENASAKVNLPDHYEMLVSYDSAIAYVSKKETERGFAELKKMSGDSVKSNLNMKILNIEEYDAGQTSKQHHAAAFDYERLTAAAENVCEAISVRGREQGDHFTPQGMQSGKKKIQDYFVDRKIPKENREHYTLVALGKEILWVFDPLYHGHNEISEKYKITSETKKVLVLEIKTEL